ncbi:hypothetical protein NPIL_329271 [Nephila pilipes]|uniref:Uncharacterized protein n=1 Tax=Nephila pilipes TaxID=299642 RepID=A0A8X6QCP1_NEPPI|nr:hypothetical protein NPIL_329271 [Nephila pilipes]
MQYKNSLLYLVLSINDNGIQPLKESNLKDVVYFLANTFDKKDIEEIDLNQVRDVVNEKPVDTADMVLTTDCVIKNDERHVGGEAMMSVQTVPQNVATDFFVACITWVDENGVTASDISVDSTSRTSVESVVLSEKTE